MAEQRQARRRRRPAGRARAPAAQRHGARPSAPGGPSRPGSPPTPCCARSTRGPTPTSRCRRSCAVTASRGATRPSRPSSPSARSAGRASTTPSSPRRPAARPPRIDPQVLDVLRLGVHQVLGMRVATHAAADQTVGLAKVVAGAGASGFVNAVMRRTSERSLEEWRDAVVPEGGGVAALAVRHSHPRVGRHRAARRPARPRPRHRRDGRRRARRTARRPTTSRRACTLVARPGLTAVDELCSYDDIEPSPISPIGVVLGSGDPGRRPGGARRARGRAGRGLPARRPRAGRRRRAADDVPARWLDLCAGPGGKAGVLGALAIEVGCRPHRGRGEPAPRRPGPLDPARPHPARQDAGSPRRGAHRRRAGGRRGRAGGLRQGARRRALHRAGGAAPPTRGALAPPAVRRRRAGAASSARCWPPRWMPWHPAVSSPTPRAAPTSPRPASSSSDVLKRRHDVEVVDARLLFTDAVGRPLEGLGEGPYVQLWPHVHGTDAMFVALLRKAG